MNRILNTKEEPVELRWPKVRNMVQAQIDRNTALYVSKRIDEEAERNSLLRWASQPGGELRPDTTPKVSKGLGEAILNIINNFTP